MLVKEKMTKNPITIFEENFISDAVDIFNEHNFHRLPVVDKQNHLIGLITEGTVQENVPSKATSLSIHEINYLLNQTKVSDIMIKKVITIGPDNLLDEAADVMVANHVYSLPVVDKGFLVGIITEKDIFTSFIEQQGFYNKGTRVVVLIENDRPGILRDIATILSAEGINITHLVVERINDDIRVVVRVDEIDSNKVVKLIGSQFNVIDVRSYR